MYNGPKLLFNLINAKNIINLTLLQKRGKDFMPPTQLELGPKRSSQNCQILFKKNDFFDVNLDANENFDKIKLFH